MARTYLGDSVSQRSDIISRSASPSTLSGRSVQLRACPRRFVRSRALRPARPTVTARIAGKPVATLLHLGHLENQKINRAKIAFGMGVETSRVATRTRLRTNTGRP